MKRFLSGLAAVAGFTIAAFAAGNPGAPMPLSAASAELTAAWVESAHIDLNWRNRAEDAVGVFVEYGNPGTPDFILLTIGRPAMTTFRHRNVAPDTTFLYRVRPYFGPISNVAAIATGRSAASGVNREGDGPLPPDAGADAGRAPRHSLRRAQPAAAPAELAAKLGASPTTVELRWKDCASDEDGYLVEMMPEGERDFKISALLPPDATSYRMTGLAAETPYAFRVRAFFHRDSSAVAQVTTPPRES